MAPSDGCKRKIMAQSMPWICHPRGHTVGRGHNGHREHVKADDERQPETVQHARDLDEEVGPFDLFLRRASHDVVREEVCEESLGQMN